MKRAIALIRKGQFSRAAQLAGSHGQASATPETEAAIRLLHPEPGIVDEADLRDLYGAPAPVTRESTKLDTATDVVLECLDAAAPLSSPHRDGWRFEHMQALARDSACADQLARVVNAIVRADVPESVASILSSSTLTVLLKKDAETMEQMMRDKGPAYVQPSRPLGMGCVLAKLANSCVMRHLRGFVADIVGPGQFAVDARGGCEQVQLALQVLMENDPDAALFSVDVVNAFNDIEPPALLAALLARPELHPLLPLYDMLYTNTAGKLWFYGDDGNLYDTFHSRRGVRQGCVLGTFLFCLAMKPVYDRLRALLGPAGLLLAYSDDIYCAADPVLAAVALSEAPPLYGKIGLRIGWGRDKTELCLPPGVDPRDLPLPRDDQGNLLPHLVDGFDACLGIPRHRDNCRAFIRNALSRVEKKHDGLLQLVEEIAEFDPLAALNMLRASGVNRFGHILSAIPPLISADFCRGRDTAVMDTYSEIQCCTPDPAQSSHHLPINLGGAGLDSLVKHARGNYLGTFFRVAGPLYARLLRMGVGVNLALALHLSQPLVTQTIHPWAWHITVSFEEARVLERSFSQEEHDLANLLLPRGNIIDVAGDPDFVNLDLPDTIQCEVLTSAAGECCGEAARLQANCSWAPPSS